MKHVGKHEFTRLVVENRQRFYRIAYGYVKNEQDALDIVSEATYKGLSHLKELREPNYFVTWMTRIIINTALESIRKNSRQVAFEESMLNEYEVTELDQEIQFDLYTALDALGAEERSFIILKYFEEYSFREIADLLDIPESTIKSKVYRCLENMRVYMEGGARP